MINKILVGLLLLCSVEAQGQIQSVRFNPRKLVFDEGRKLPAEKAFIFLSDVGRNITMAKMEILKSANKNSSSLYANYWKRSSSDINNMASISNEYKLRPGKAYNFLFKYYRQITAGERPEIVKIINKSAQTILATNIKVTNDKYKMLVSSSELYMQLNDYLASSSINYEVKNGEKSISFSSIVEQSILTLNRSQVGNDSSVRFSQYDLLKKQIKNEIVQIVNAYQYVLEEEAFVRNYEVEGKERSMALNFGYGGILKENKLTNVNYFSAPYAGISFPLGNSNFSSGFWNNSSISAGVFLKNFKDSNSVKTTGPIVGLPLYGAYGYKLLDFLRIQAGVAVIEQKNTGINPSNVVYVKPFVGLSIEINMWLGIGKK